MQLERPWLAYEKRLREVAESPSDWDPNVVREDAGLSELGLVTSGGDLTPLGDDIYTAKFVRGHRQAAREALGRALQRNKVATAFCERLWPMSEIPVSGAVSLMKRITGSGEDSAKRWLEMLNAGGLIAYNRNRSTMRILYNPSELLPPDQGAEREKTKGHVMSPETPFGNLLALRDLLRSARGTIRWYEQHMPGKVLEVLYREIERGKVACIQLLSGPANITQDLKDDFKRFTAEIKRERDIDVEWRVLSKKDAFKHHDRHFFADGIARNLPPLNSILAGSTGEILDSSVTLDDFDDWWSEGVALASVTV